MLCGRHARHSAGCDHSVKVLEARSPTSVAWASDVSAAEPRSKESSGLPSSGIWKAMVSARPPPAAAQGVRRLFEAARELYLCAPWKHVQDDVLLRVDVPELGLEGACISITGALGRSFGFVAFPSQVAYEAFLQATARGMPEEGPVDLGTPHLALNFEAHRDVPKTLLREAAAHGWALASSKAYPLPMRIDRDAVPRPLEPHDLDVLAAATLALARLFAAHGEAVGRGQPSEATSVHRDGIEARACCGRPMARSRAPSSTTTPASGRKAHRANPCPIRDR